MSMNRRRFLWACGGSAAVAAARAAVPRAMPAAPTDLAPAPRKHWAWMRGNVKAMDEWRRTLGRLRGAGIEAILIGGAPDFYRTVAPVVRAEGLELHAWIFTLMRGEHVKTHP